LTDAALDAEACPLCGFPLVGPVVLSPAAGPGGRRVVPVAAASLLVLVIVGVLLLDREPRTAVAPPTVEAVPVGAAPPAAPARATVQLAPMPREVRFVAAPPADAAPEPRKVERPVGVVMKVDPKITPQRHFDHPDDTAALPDLRSGDNVTLTGRVRVLRLGSVGGNGVLDASGLTAEEVHITGDLGGESLVVLNAPNGTVTVGGYVSGAAKLSVAAPGGAVVVAGSGRVANGAQITATAKRVEVKCPVSDGARLQVTLTSGGVLKLTRTEDGASVIYTKAAPNDPPPVIEPGLVRDRAKVVEGKK
jgi:hypothetical protein